MFLIVRVARTSEQAGIATSIVALVLGIGGGAFFPVSCDRPVHVRCSTSTRSPRCSAGWARRPGGGGIADIGVPVAIMLGFGAVMLLVSRLVPGPRGAVMRNALSVAGVELRLFLRDRSNLFFVFVFPLLLVLMIGAAVRRGRPDRPGGGERLGLDAAVTRSSTSSSTTTSSCPTRRGRTPSTCWRGAARRGRPRRRAAATAYDAGRGGHAGAGARLRRATRRWSSRTSGSPSTRCAPTAPGSPRWPTRRPRPRGSTGGCRARRGRTPGLEVHYVDALSKEFAGLGQFDFGASGQLLLFVFLSCLSGSATLIQARRLGVVARMLAGPMTAGELVGRSGPRTVGDRPLPGRLHHDRHQPALRRCAGGASRCRCSSCCSSAWSRPARPSCSARCSPTRARPAARVSGSAWCSPRSAARCCRWSCSPTRCGRSPNITPHAWAYDAFAEVQRRGGTLVDVLPNLGVLAGMAVVLPASAPGPCAGALRGRCDRPAGRGTRSAGAPTPRRG